MIIRNIISERGFKYIYVNKSPPNELQIINVVLTEPFIYSFKRNNTTPHQSPFVSFSTNTTASLPNITVDNVGVNYMLALTSSNGQMLLSASNPINDGLWTRTITNKNMIWCFASIVATNKFSWIVTSSSLF